MKGEFYKKDSGVSISKRETNYLLQVCVCVINIAKNSLNFDRSKSALNATLKRIKSGLSKIISYQNIHRAQK